MFVIWIFKIIHQIQSYTDGSRLFGYYSQTNENHQYNKVLQDQLLNLSSDGCSNKNCLFTTVQRWTISLWHICISLLSCKKNEFWVVLKKPLQLKLYLWTGMNFNFLPNSLIHYIYSNEFSVCWITSEIPLLIWCQAASSYPFRWIFSLRI